MKTVLFHAVAFLFVTGVLYACDKIDHAQTRNDFSDVMLELQTNIQEFGYKVSRVQQVDVGMKKAGYNIDEYRVVFFAKPEEVRIILRDYPEFASFLPLSITIYRDGDTTRLLGMPFALPRAQDNSQKIAEMITAWEKDTADILRMTIEASERENP